MDPPAAGGSTFAPLAIGTVAALVCPVTLRRATLFVNVAPVPTNDPADGVGNIDFVLEDAGGTTILTGNSTFGNSTESNVVINGSFSTGTHYIRVFAADSSTGTYQISWYVN